MAKVVSMPRSASPFRRATSVPALRPPSKISASRLPLPVYANQRVRPGVTEVSQHAVGPVGAGVHVQHQPVSGLREQHPAVAQIREDGLIWSVVPFRMDR